MTMAHTIKSVMFTFILWALTSSTSADLSDFRDKVRTDQTAFYLKEQIIGRELERTVKTAYRKFLESAPIAQKHRIDSYFSEWRLVVDVNGPFADAEKQERAFDAISEPSDFNAALYMEQLLENREDSEEFKNLFQKTMISSDTVKLQVYFTGDGDIINSVVVASLKNNGDLYIVTSIFD